MEGSTVQVIMAAAVHRVLEAHFVRATSILVSSSECLFLIKMTVYYIVAM